jgi:WXG100 family type VII secretion target
MANGYAGTPAEFATASGHVDEAMGTMNGQLSKLRAAIEATSGGWVGEAAQAFQNVMTRFDEQSLKLTGALGEIGDLLKQTGGMYSGQETDVSRRIKSQISGRLG